MSHATVPYLNKENAIYHIQHIKDTPHGWRLNLDRWQSSVWLSSVYLIHLLLKDYSLRC